MDILEAEAARIRAKADEAASSGDYHEARRLEVIAECLWPNDPVQRAVDALETERLAAKYATSPAPHKPE